MRTRMGITWAALAAIAGCSASPTQAPFVGAALDASDDAPPCPFYLDADGDGFGDALAEPICTETAGYVRDHTDCNDSDARAFPGQTMFFATSEKGTSPPRFDFNCDGVETQEITTTGVCDPTSCAGSKGWAFPPAPACGATASYVTDCKGPSGTCGEVTAPTAQSCR